MQTLSVDFDVWKALTARRESESDSYNDVLRRLLNLQVATGGRGEARIPTRDGGRMLGRRWLPNGTRLKARYKGQTFHAEIRDGALIDEVGTSYNSASAAAKAITETSVNGLLFWTVKRPSDDDWQLLTSVEKLK